MLNVSEQDRSSPAADLQKVPAPLPALDVATFTLQLCTNILLCTLSKNVEI